MDNKINIWGVPKSAIPKTQVSLLKYSSLFWMIWGTPWLGYLHIYTTNQPTNQTNQPTNQGWCKKTRWTPFPGWTLRSHCWSTLGSWPEAAPERQPKQRHKPWSQLSQSMHEMYWYGFKINGGLMVKSTKIKSTKSIGHLGVSYNGALQV